MTGTPAGSSGTAAADAGAVFSAFRCGRWYESLDTATVPGPGGLRLSLIPDVVVRADLAGLRCAGGLGPGPGGAAARRRMVACAVEAFTHSTLTVGGLGRQTPVEFRDAMREVAGLPPVLVDRWCGLLRQAVAELTDDADPRDDTVGVVSLPANTFTCLVAVAELAGRCGSVLVRPSRREPVSAARFVAALLDAGWPPARLGLYPTEPGVLRTLLHHTDEQIVYGGDDAVRGLPARRGLSVRGPGRGTAVVGRDADSASTADWLFALIAADSGRFCKNVCTVVCAGDPTALTDALGAMLDGIALDPPDPQWPVAAHPEPLLAGRIAARITGGLRPADRRVTRRSVLMSTAAGPVLAPTLVQVADPAGHPLVGCELPFPFAAVLAADPATVRVVTAGSRFVYRTVERGGAAG